MATTAHKAGDAQFKKGEIVWHWTGEGDSDKELAVVTEITNKNPAQYHFAVFGTNTESVCGEGVKEINALSAL